MPFKDDDRRREYQRERARKRSNEARAERNRRDRERRAAKRQADREALPEPERPVLSPHQRDLYDVLESAEPPRLLTIRKGARATSPATAGMSRAGGCWMRTASRWRGRNRPQSWCAGRSRRT